MALLLQFHHTLICSILFYLDSFSSALHHSDLSQFCLTHVHSNVPVSSLTLNQHLKHRLSCIQSTPSCISSIWAFKANGLTWQKKALRGSSQIIQAAAWSLLGELIPLNDHIHEHQVSGCRSISECSNATRWLREVETRPEHSSSISLQPEANVCF